MKQKIEVISLILFFVLLLVSFTFEGLSNTTTWGLFIGLTFIAGSVLFIASSYNNKD